MGLWRIGRILEKLYGDCNQSPVNILTYEAYMVEPQVDRRYDIINGVWVFVPGATFRHQLVSKNLTNLLTALAEESGIGLLVPTPLDVLIRRIPKMANATAGFAVH